MTEIKILEATRRPSSAPDRPHKMDVSIRYQVDSARIYTLDVPEELATPEEVQKRIIAAEKERSKLVGLQFKVP